MAASVGLTQLTEVMSELAAEDVVGLTDHELAERAVELDRLRSLLEATQAATLEQARRRGVGQILGYRSDATWLADATRNSHPHCSKQLRRARVLDQLPGVRQAWLDGDITTAHVDTISKLARQRKYARATVRDEVLFVEWAREQQWPEFAQFCDVWAEMNDPVDPSEIEQRAMDERGMWTAEGVDHTTLIEIQTPNLAWSQACAVLQAIEDRLFEIECDEVRAAEGRTDGPVDADRLPRTSSMRRHDAMMIALRLAATAPEAGEFGLANAETLVMVDLDTLLAEAERLYGDRAPDVVGDEVEGDDISDISDNETGGNDTGDGDLDGDDCDSDRAREADPETAERQRRVELDRRIRRFRCETRNGFRITPTAALVHSIGGTMRRVACTTRSLDLEASAEARFFTGPLRKAILARSPRCVGPGCGANAWRCDVDHAVRHTDGGKTVPINGLPSCGPCHRWKSQLEMLGLWPPAPPPGAHCTPPAEPEYAGGPVRPGPDHPALIRPWQADQTDARADAA